MTIQNKKYGWKPDLPDFRDRQIHFQRDIALPPLIDLRPEMPPVYDQGNLGSCTANAIGAAFSHELIKQNISTFTPSRLFIYYNERDMEGTINSDAGAEIRDGIKSLTKWGVCGEDVWPYDISKFTHKPSDLAYLLAKKDLLVQYQRVAQDSNAIGQILNQGWPVTIGFTVYESFESKEVAQNGILPMPSQDESILGGHAVLIVGIDFDKKMFIVRNSWGSDWGQAGYFMAPFDYFCNQDLASDLWVIQSVT